MSTQPLVVGVGASAGGLGITLTLLAAIGNAPGMAIIFVRHLEPSSTSLLASILANSTPMKVVEIVDGERLIPGTV